jgi:ABC-type glutathione transport system ATPase component
MLSNSVLEKIILARCLVIKPALLIISYPVFMLEKSERNYIYNILMDRNIPMTVCFISNDIDLQQASDLVFVLEKGPLKAPGTYEKVKPIMKAL